MANGVIDAHQTLAYNKDNTTLIVMLSSKMANEMRKDGWDVSFDQELGHFISIVKG